MGALVIKGPHMKTMLALLLLFSTTAFAADCCNCQCSPNQPIDWTAPAPAAPVVATPVPANGDPGKGSWVPMAGRLVADPSGNAAWTTTYAPGCLNGLTAANSSSGCSAQTSFNGFSLGSGRSLVLRYKSTPTAGSSVKYIRTRSYDGGNVGVNLRVWLSADPAAKYASVIDACKQTSTRTPMVITGPRYCPVSPNTTYYYGMEYDELDALRFQVEEKGADFY